MYKKGRDDLSHSLLAALSQEEILPLDCDAAAVAGRVYGALEKRGQPIGRADPLIAGVALYHNLVLVTGNLKRFERITALGFPLRLADWRV